VCTEGGKREREINIQRGMGRTRGCQWGEGSTEE